MAIRKIEIARKETKASADVAKMTEKFREPEEYRKQKSEEFGELKVDLATSNKENVQEVNIKFFAEKNV